MPRAVLLWTCALALAAVSCGPPAMPASAPSALLGKPLPRLERRTVAGTPVDTASLAGKTVVVKFFADYCEPCKWTLPEAQALSTAREDVVVIGIAEDEREGDVRALVETYGLTFPVIHDRGQVLAGRFRVRELPATFVASPDGTIRWVGGAGQHGGELKQAVKAAKALAP